MKLIKKGEEMPIEKTSVWVEQKNGKEVVKRKLYTCYGTTLAEIEVCLLEFFKEKK